MRLRLALVWLLAQQCAAGAAPAADASKDFPAGWCDTQHGTPTRTTGECMCKTACEGSGCRREQGGIWYSYASCSLRRDSGDGYSVVTECVAPSGAASAGLQVSKPGRALASQEAANAVELAEEAALVAVVRLRTFYSHLCASRRSQTRAV